MGEIITHRGCMLRDGTGRNDDECGYILLRPLILRVRANISTQALGGFIWRFRVVIFIIR